jgi:choline dehydrogenase
MAPTYGMAEQAASIIRAQYNGIPPPASTVSTSAPGSATQTGTSSNNPNGGGSGNGNGSGNSNSNGAGKTNAGVIALASAVVGAVGWLLV